MKNKPNPLATAVIIMFIQLLIFIACMSARAQDVRTTLGVYSDPNATTKDGFNIGATLDYQRTVMYNKVNVFYFPKLRGVDYLEVSATLLGFNAHIGYFNTHRLHVGYKVGGVFRETGAPHPIMGFEVGYEWYLTDGFFIGLLATYEYRTDNKIWEAQAEPYWRKNGFIKIGITL